MAHPESNGFIRDFSLDRTPIHFRADGDEFVAPASLAVPTLRRLGSMHARLGDLTGGSDTDVESLLSLVTDMFGHLLPGPSGRRFVERLKSEGRPADPEADPPRLDDEPVPLDLMKQAIPILYYLLERYGLRPTEPSSASPAGSTEAPTATPSDGISSTDGALLEASATLN